jgi:hypothetical protein
MKSPMLRKEYISSKYAQPRECSMPSEEWYDWLGYCWAYANYIDEGGKPSEWKCPIDCELRRRHELG